MSSGADPALAAAVAAHRAGRLDEAAAGYAAVLARQPQAFDALHLLGVVEQQRGRLDAALALFERARQLHDDDPALHSNLAALWRAKGDRPRALVHAERALALAPGHVEALVNRAGLLLELGRAPDALAGYDAALARAPTLAQAHLQRGFALALLGRPADALAAVEAARRHDPALPGAWAQRAAALAEAGRLDEAVASARRVVELAPERPGALGQWLQLKAQAADWRDWDAGWQAAAEALAAGRPAVPPHAALLSPLPAVLQRRAAETFVAATVAPPAPRPAPAPAGPRLRVGFFSPDFRQHPTAQLIAAVIEAHDRARFEFVGCSLAPPATADAMTARVRAAFDRWVDLSALDDAEAAAAARALPLDIAVDLAGCTRGGRPGLFARRAAPLQLAWLGFAGTSGAPAIDGLVADATVMPPGCEAEECSEALLLRLPCWLPADPGRPVDAPPPPRAALGLPASALVLCCFNRVDKLSPPVFDAWLRLLAALPQAVLWLLEPARDAARRLRDRLQAAGLDAARLVLAPRLSAAAHRARLAAADLALDTWPFNGHTTATEVLWSGVPMVTLRHPSFAGRAGASLLGALGLPELVTGSVADYEATVRSLAADPARRAALREALRARRAQAAPWDAAGFARSLEAGLEAAWRQRSRLR